jgi:2-methylcitrate dehydratase
MEQRSLMADTLIARLATWVSEFDYDRVPEHVLGKVKLSLLDALGAAFAAWSYSAEARATVAVLNGVDYSAACSVIGGSRASVLNATLMNGALIRALDLNDYQGIDPRDGTKLSSHPSDAMAVGLAVGELTRSSGRDFLSAMAMGYEINGRLQRIRGHGSPWDTSTCTGLMSAAIAGRLMRLSHPELAAALAFGMAHGVTPGSVRTGDVISAGKFIADPVVAMTGVLAALLAGGGITGPLTVFEGAKGVRSSVFGDADLTDLLSPVTGPYMVEGTCIKVFPCFANSQAAVIAALEARRSFGRSHRDIDFIELRLADTKALVAQLGDVTSRSPANQETADHSYPFVVAAAVIDGDLTLDSYAARRWADSDLADLMGRVRITPDGTWNERVTGASPATVTIVGKDGARAQAEVAYPAGHARNPIGWDGVAGKFRRNVRRLIASDRTEAIVDAVYSLDRTPALAGLTDLLAASDRSA